MCDYDPLVPCKCLVHLNTTSSNCPVAYCWGGCSEVSRGHHQHCFPDVWKTLTKDVFQPPSRTMSQTKASRGFDPGSCSATVHWVLLHARLTTAVRWLTYLPPLQIMMQHFLHQNSPGGVTLTYILKRLNMITQPMIDKIYTEVSIK